MQQIDPNDYDRLIPAGRYVVTQLTITLVAPALDAGLRYLKKNRYHTSDGVNRVCPWSHP